MRIDSIFRWVFGVCRLLDDDDFAFFFLAAAFDNVEVNAAGHAALIGVLDVPKFITAVGYVQGLDESTG